MIYLRKSNERGYAEHGWLKSYHTFSFADYYAPEFMGFKTLRVINEDYIQQGRGFPLHGHRDMEIITLVLSGQIEHKDILGNQEIVPVGHVQVMSAGNGIKHSEYNPSATEPLSLLQIWIEPNVHGIPARYERKDFTNLFKEQGLKTFVSNQLDDSTQLFINQNAKIHHGLFTGKKSFEIELKVNSSYWVQFVKVEQGDLILMESKDNNMNQIEKVVTKGDGLAIENESLLSFKNSTGSEVEFFMFELF